MTVTVCAECDVVLQPGPAPQEIAEGESVEQETTAADEPDTYFTTLPGQQADFVVNALAQAGIFSVLSCQGEQRLHGPEKPTDGLRQVERSVAAELKAETTRWFGQRVPPFEAGSFRR